MPHRAMNHEAVRAGRIDGTRRALALLALMLGLAGAAMSASMAPAAESSDPFDEHDRAYWALQPVRRPEIPKLSPQPSNPIDAFVLARLNRAGISPLGAADKRTLLRRASFDVQGLPPSPEEMAALLADDAPDAYPRIVDRLLASPRFGEHWARHWLDLVRYAESDGFKTDELRENAWRYRDYVIGALNDDKPYDRFVTEQLAGDELVGDDPETFDAQAVLATGFLRLGPYESNARDVLDQRANILNDITDVAGQVFLGLTVGCARCHDHKYDPILQRDYFRLQAFFAGLKLGEEEPLAAPREQAEYDRSLRDWEDQTRDLREQVATLEAPYREKLLAQKRSYFPGYVQTVFNSPPGERSPLERQMIVLAERQVVVEEKELAGAMSSQDKTRWEQLRGQLQAFDSTRPRPLARAMIARDCDAAAPDTFMPGREDHGAVAPGFLSVLDGQAASIEPPKPRAKSSGRRLALARWIANPRNPLTARVYVNRIWQQYSGRGLVATSNDFGIMGSPPTHPELLDFLADELVRGGWRAKAIHRLILNSEAYRRASLAASDQSSPAALAAQKTDPSNELLWRAERKRLTGEQLRDALLATSGELHEQQGGESVRPELPAGLSPAYAWKPTADEHQRNRRSIYLLVRRNLREPLLESLDMPDTHESCSRRLTTTTAPQALVLINGRWTLDRSRALAARVLAGAAHDPASSTPAGGQHSDDGVGEYGTAARVRRAYLLAFEREPDADEIAVAVRFLDEQANVIAARLAGGESVALPVGQQQSPDLATAAALVDLCHVLLNSNEFVYLD